MKLMRSNVKTAKKGLGNGPWTGRSFDRWMRLRFGARPMTPAEKKKYRRAGLLSMPSE